VYLIAGEASGDLLGGRLMEALKQKDSSIIFSGVGGDLMQAEGLRSEFPMAELSVMGVAEVLRHAPLLLRRIRETAAHIIADKPDVVVTIDAPDFCFRVAQRVKKAAPHVKFIHYVAPSVWAWRPKRAAKVAKFLDHILALLPFEPPYFEKEGLACTFVGHPAARQAGKGNAARFRDTYKIPDKQKIVALLPGSRRGEVERLLPVFLRVAEEFKRRHPDVVFVLPTVTHVAGIVRAHVAKGDLPVLPVEGEEARYDAFAASHAALAASGTVALELSLARVPSVIAYKANPLTAFLARRLVKLRYVSLPNLILDKEIMPELLQEEATTENLLAALETAYRETPERQRQLDAGAKIKQILQPGGADPSERAAQVVLNYLLPMST
jgi:lipid-A-disaccharide synthase